MKIDRNNKLLTLSIPVFLFALVVVAYIPAMSGGFVWDDDLHITHNPLLRTLDGLGRIWFEPGAWPHYYPLTLTSFWIQFHLWGLDPFGYHLTNIIIHGFNTLLLWFILRKIGVSGALPAACIFGLHPVHVESVAWATENKNVLSGFFYLSSLLVYINYLFRSNDTKKDCLSNAEQLFWKLPESCKSSALYSLALILFLFALFSKTVTCSLPAVILLLIWWKCDRINRHDLFALIPFFIFGIVLGLSTVWTEIYNVGSSDGLAWNLTYLERTLVAGKALWFYISKLVFPVNLAFMYPKWDIDSNSLLQYLYLAGCLIVLLLLWFLRKKIGKGPLVSILIFSGTLLPALGFFNLYTMRYSYVADHFQYLASISLIVLFCSGLTQFNHHYKSRKGVTIRLIVYGIILALFGSTVWHEAYRFKSPEALWRDTISKNNNVAIAHSNLGNILYRQGKYSEAMTHAFLAVQIDPALYEAHNNLGSILLKLNHYKQAQEHFLKAIQIDPEKHNPYSNMGVSFFMLGNFDKAITYFRKALQIKPDYGIARSNLNKVLRIREDNKRHRFDI